MTTFTQDILEAAKGKPILAISVGRSRKKSFLSQKTDHSLGQEPVSWELAEPVLNYTYDAGYGGQDCHDIIAWTDSHVLFIHEYDGSTYIRTMPRNPTAIDDDY